MWARRRQFFILTALCALIATALYGGYQTVRTGPTCSDGERNQGEIGVDCGGPCAKVCPDEAAALSVLWTKVFRVSDGLYDIASLIENRNIGFAATAVPYSVKIYDPENLLITEQKGVTYANQKQQFLLFLPSVDVGKRIPYRAFLELGAPSWQRLTGVSENPAFDTENKIYSAEPTPRVTVDIVNRSLHTVRNAEAYAILSDAHGNAFAVSGTHLPELARGEHFPTLFTWPEKFAEEPALIDVLVRVPPSR